jgi:putative copper export protein
MNIDYLNLALRAIHILAAATAIGGMVMWRFVLLPELHGATDEPRALLRDQFRKRWAMIVHICITFLAISGLVNFMMFMKVYKSWTDAAGNNLWKDNFGFAYQMLFGAKTTVAILVFLISSALAGRSAVTKNFRDNAKFWLNVNLVLILAIVVMSGILRQTHLGPPAGNNYKVELKAEAAK